MKIALIGQSAFGKSVLEALVEKGEDEIVGVFSPPTKEGRSPDPISDAAKELDIPIFDLIDSDGIRNIVSKARSSRGGLLFYFSKNISG